MNKEKCGKSVCVWVGVGACVDGGGGVCVCGCVWMLDGVWLVH